MVHDNSSRSALATPAARPRHALKDGLMVGLELAESGPALDFEPKQVSAGTRVFFGAVSTLVAHLYLVVTQFLYGFRESGYWWSTAGVLVYECSVNAERVADPEGFEVGFE